MTIASSSTRILVGLGAMSLSKSVIFSCSLRDITNSSK